MARTATGSTAEMILENVKISTGVIEVLYTRVSLISMAGILPIQSILSTAIRRPPITKKLKLVP